MRIELNLGKIIEFFAKTNRNVVLNLSKKETGIFYCEYNLHKTINFNQYLGIEIIFSIIFFTVNKLNCKTKN